VKGNYYNVLKIKHKPLEENAFADEYHSARFAVPTEIWRRDPRPIALKTIMNNNKSVIAKRKVNVGHAEQTFAIIENTSNSNIAAALRGAGWSNHASRRHRAR
jgi:hypothetical protein